MATRPKEPKPKRQHVLTIYFPESSGTGKSTGSYGKNVSIAFPPDEIDLYNFGRSLSSGDIRTIAKASNYAELKKSSASSSSVSGYIRECLREEMASHGDDSINPSFLRGPLEHFAPSIEDSPETMRELLHEFAPNARQVLDPFAGTGAVVIAAAQVGIESWWCELNPFYQYVTSLKIDLLKRARGREGIVERLSSRKTGMEHSWKSARPAEEYRAELHRRFRGNAQILALEDDLLRARTWVDSVHLRDPLIARILGVAIATGAARESRSTRTEPRGVMEQVRSELDEWKSFLERAPETFVVPRFLTDNAFDLGELKPLRIDTVCSVPPLLNTTEVSADELAGWFLRLPPIPDAAASEMSEVASIEQTTQPKRAIWLGKVLDGKADAGAYRRAGLNDRSVETFDHIDRKWELLRALYSYKPAQAVRVADHLVMIGRAADAMAVQLDAEATIILILTDDWIGDIEIPMTDLVTKIFGRHGFQESFREVRETRQSTRGQREIRENVLVLERGRGASATAARRSGHGKTTRGAKRGST